MVGITKRLEQQYPDYNTGTSADVVGLQEKMVETTACARFSPPWRGSLVLPHRVRVNVANLLPRICFARAGSGH
jgi:hypothetical protein